MTSARHGAIPSGDVGSAQADDPPAWALPLAVPANITLVRRPDLYARVTSICAFPTGFLFFLVLGFDIRTITFSQIDFYSPRERRHPAPARLQVRFSDGRVTSSHPRRPEDVMLRYNGGNSHPAAIPSSEAAHAFQRHETRWWVSRLPPPGDLEFAIYLRDSSEVVGAGRCDSQPVLDAATRSAALWNPAEGSR